MTVDAADAVWRRFVERVVVAIDLAARHLAEEEVRAELEASEGWFGRRRGGAAAQRRVPQENAITQALQETLQQWARSMYLTQVTPIQGLPDISRMYFAIEQPPGQAAGSMARRLGRKAPRTDLRIEIRDEADLDLRLEAKVLVRPGDVSSTYLGPSGIGRFDDRESPYTLGRWGGMIAYVVDETQATWTARIAAALAELRPGHCEQLAIDERTHPVTLHDLTGVEGAAAVVRVVHLAVEVESDPSSRP